MKKLKFLFLFLPFMIFLLYPNKLKANEELLQKTFGEPKGKQEIGEMDTKDCKQGARCIANKFINRDDSINDIDSQKTIYKQILQEIEKYTPQDESTDSSSAGNSNTKAGTTTGGSKNLPFAKGNDGNYTKVEDIFDDEDDYIRNKETKYCNKPLRDNGDSEENAYTLDELLAPGKLLFAWPCIMSSWNHKNGKTTKKSDVDGLFEHKSFGGLLGCYEEHRVTAEAKNKKGLKVVGEYIATFGQNAVPLQYRPNVCTPLKKLGCTKWTIKADKIEYYFPTKKITLSKQPLYTRFIENKNSSTKDGDVSIEDLFKKYEDSVKGEMKSSKMSKKTAETHLKSKQKDEGSTITNSSSTTKSYNRPLKPSKSPDATFLGQIDRGYGRYFKLEDVETDWSNAKGPEDTLVLPHVSAEKKYFGTDFEDNTDEFFEEKNDKKNLAFFIDPGKKYKHDTLKKKHEDHIDNPWKSLQHDTIGGASIVYQSYYSGEGAKAFKEVLPKGKEASNISTTVKNDYRSNNISYGVGNVSNLMSLTPQGSSDYILETLVRTHNMFLEELKPIQDIKQGDQDLSINAGSSTEAGDYFVKTTLGERGERQSFKTKWDMFHCPIGDYDDGENQPQLFNEFLNKAVEEIMKISTGSSSTSTEGKTCFKYENLLRNNLDLDQVNGILSKYYNVKVVANKGETSFTIYTLFSGTVGFPGQGYPFWKYGIGGEKLGPIQYYHYNRKNGSKADPEIKNEQFRLF